MKPLQLPPGEGLLLTSTRDWFLWTSRHGAPRLISLDEEGLRVTKDLHELTPFRVVGYAMAGPSKERFRAAVNALASGHQASRDVLSQLEGAVMKTLRQQEGRYLKGNQILDVLEKIVAENHHLADVYLTSLGQLRQEGHARFGNHHLPHKRPSETSRKSWGARDDYELMLPIWHKSESEGATRGLVRETRTLIPTDHIVWRTRPRAGALRANGGYVNFLLGRVDNGSQEQPDDPSATPMTIPLSFLVPDAYFPSVGGWPNSWPPFPGQGALPQPGQNGWTDALVQLLYESVLAKWGLNTYDGACWEIALFLSGRKQTAMSNLRRQNKTTQFASIDCRSDGDEVVLFHLVSRDNSGFEVITAKDLPTNVQAPTFRMISNYFSYKPQDNTTKAPQFIATIYDEIILQWMDWRPITGEMVWMWLIGPGQTGDDATRILDTLPYLEDKVEGGFYYSPINRDLNILQLSTENNASAYGGLSLVQPKLSGSSGDQVKEQMAGIVKYFQQVVDKTAYFFYQGRTWQPTPGASDNFAVKPGQYILNGLLSDTVKDNLRLPDNFNQAVVIPVDCQTWTIASLQPDVIDQQIFQEEGATLKVWSTLRATCGQFSGVANGNSQVLNGFGYNNMRVLMDSDGQLVDANNDPTNQPVPNTTVSGEWTLGAILAGEVLVAYYTDPKYQDQIEAIKKDLVSMRSFVNSSALTQNGSVLYATQRAPTGFGWNANPIPSTTSTAWAIFDQLKFNPFVPLPSGWKSGEVNNYLRRPRSKLVCQSQS